jgi:nucleoredoxin
MGKQIGLLVLVAAAVCLAIVAWPVSPPKITVTPAGSTPALPPASPFLAKFANHLMVLGPDGQPKGFDDAKLAGISYVAFYYSASWCPPCRAFTPSLVQFYNEFKPSHPNFELIFVNDDRSEDDMLNYMKGDAMPWPAVWFADIRNPDLNARQFCGSGIPDLVLVDSSGNVLSDSFSWGGYIGPQHVVDDIQKMVR